MKSNKAKRILRRTAQLTALLLGFAVAAVAAVLPLGFSGAFPRMEETLTETCAISRGTQFILEALQDPAYTKQVMDRGLLNKNFPAFTSTDSFADPADFDRELRVECFSLKGSSFVGHVLVIHDPLLVELYITPGMGVRGNTLSEFNEIYTFAAAVNAGGYLDNDTLLGKGGIPAGSVISDGRIVWKPYDDTVRENLVGFTSEGVLVYGYWTAEYAVSQMGVEDAVCFKPALVHEGKGLITEGTGGYGYAPRTAIGQRSDGAVVMVVLEGRRPSSIGATLLDVQNVLLDYDCYTGCLLDGGSCSTMVFNARRQSRCVDIFGERPVPSVFGVTMDALIRGGR